MNLSSARRHWLRSGAFSVVFASALLLSARAFPQDTTPATDSSEVHGIAVANMDPSVKPGDNFYLYSNGGWIARTQIPPDRAGLSVFSVLLDRSNKEVAGIIEEAAKSNAPFGSSDRKIADYYNAYMNEAAIEARGLKPLQPHLDAIAALRDKQDLARYLGTTLRADVDLLNNAVFSTPNLFGLWIAPGFSDSDHYAVYLLQGGLEMPSQSYYLDDSDRMKEIRTKYAAHVAAMLKLAGLSDTEARATRVVALEHAIAEVHVPLSDIEDIAKANNPWTRSDFASKAPGLDWNAYFDGAGLARQQNFIVWTPTAFTGEAALVASTPLDTWKDWLAYHLIEDYAGVLPGAVADEDFSFTGKVLSGVDQQRPRWQRAVGLVNVSLGDAVGQIYARKYFPPEAKAEAQAMVANLIAAYHKRIAAIPWLAPSTRAEAQAKLDTLYVGIGYPETWKDYSAYEVRPDDAFGNSWRYELWKYRTQVARIGKPVDRHEWSMTPQTVNAVNLPLQNALNFPAAILQPPFFDPKAPAAHNYGAIGTVIGHEISHTFDAEGSAFDSRGRVRNWWTPADHAHFEEQAQKLVEQYDAYEPFPGLHVNGKQTIDENIADLGGVAAAYDGYHASLHGKQPPRQDGFTGDQQFYISFGQNWASKAREAAMRRQVLTDGHSPGEFRADIVRNSDAWYKAFNVQPGEKLYLAPENRVRIW
ncbi:MAG: M13 family metallopeptidase [Acidobacteriaceae bacterium]